MARYYHMKNTYSYCRSSGLMLSVCWAAGTVCGIFFFLYAGTPLVSLMRRTLVGSVSIVSLFGIGLIPFLFTAYAVFVSKLQLVYGICFLKAFLFSFVSIGISVAFASAGWLARSLLLFSGGIWCSLLFFLWSRLLSGQRVCWAAVLFIGLLIGGIMGYIISPFLAGLIEN